MRDYVTLSEMKEELRANGYNVENMASYEIIRLWQEL